NGTPSPWKGPPRPCARPKVWPSVQAIEERRLFAGTRCDDRPARRIAADRFTLRTRQQAQVLTAAAAHRERHTVLLAFALTSWPIGAVGRQRRLATLPARRSGAAPCPASAPRPTSVP